MISWIIEPNSAGNWTVVGEHYTIYSSRNPGERKYERYPFQTLEWAKLCLKSMEKLSGAGFTTTPTTGFWATGISSSNVISTLVTKEYLEERLREQQLHRVVIKFVRTWLIPKVVSFSKVLWYGEQGMAKCAR